MSTPPQPPIGGLCDRCGHFAARHDESGCDTQDLVAKGIRKSPCRCRAMVWLGTSWPRPWLPYPEGTR